MVVVSVSRYLYTRLAQLGVRSLHGVPGDFNIASLDELAKSGLKWVGNCNELNAGYAADGYARVKKIGALASTYGVGELSSINAIAGSYAENVPVVQIVGQPSRKVLQSGRLFHHSLGDSSTGVFADMHRRVTAAQTTLDDPLTATREIDRVLKACIDSKKPVYIGKKVEIVSKANTANERSYPRRRGTPSNLFLVYEILRKLHNAERPVLLVDAGARQHGLVDIVQQLMIQMNIPTVTTPMGKSIVNESLPNFHGVYDGADSGITEMVRSADLVISIGAIRSDLNTFGFMAIIDPAVEISLDHNSVVLETIKHEIPTKAVLENLIRELKDTELRFPSLPPLRPTKNTLAPEVFPEELRRSFPSTSITHEYLWPRISSWLKPKDIILNSSGTSNVGICETKFPPESLGISQVLWSSIGYTLAAAQGAALAAEELGGGRRVVVFEGDGAFQMTAQEISTMLKLKLKPIIFVLNNEGYTIERWINGPSESYNDVGDWNYAGLPHMFGAGNDALKTYKVETRAQLESLLADSSFGDAPCLQLVELRMPKEDAPLGVKRLIEQIVTKKAPVH
ncbi:pyruvate decarboxylase [Lophiotrema nucula]|uniref:Pyruvate decarboxylase n=1 Tax=Lophiotrema nucula TaxID=690887 RepID=A0A6A5YHB7_9PLEO|nr:pyruvate decarboxylase [Lophiotrema nucula]